MNEETHTTSAYTSAADTLDRAREGSSLVVQITLARLSEARGAIESGDFEVAEKHMTEALNFNHMLASTQTNLARYQGSSVVRGDELERGMNVYQGGVVVGKEAEETFFGPMLRVAFSDGGEQLFPPQMQVLVVPDEDDRP